MGVGQEASAAHSVSVSGTDHVHVEPPIQNAADGDTVSGADQTHVEPPIQNAANGDTVSGADQAHVEPPTQNGSSRDHGRLRLERPLLSSNDPGGITLDSGAGMAIHRHDDSARDADIAAVGEELDSWLGLPTIQDAYYADLHRRAMRVAEMWRPGSFRNDMFAAATAEVLRLEGVSYSHWLDHNIMRAFTRRLRGTTVVAPAPDVSEVGSWQSHPAARRQVSRRERRRNAPAVSSADIVIGTLRPNELVPTSRVADIVVGILLPHELMFRGDTPVFPARYPYHRFSYSHSTLRDVFHNLVERLGLGRVETHTLETPRGRIMHNLDSTLMVLNHHRTLRRARSQYGGGLFYVLRRQGNAVARTHDPAEVHWVHDEHDHELIQDDIDSIAVQLEQTGGPATADPMGTGESVTYEFAIALIAGWINDVPVALFVEHELASDRALRCIGERRDRCDVYMGQPDAAVTVLRKLSGAGPDPNQLRVPIGSWDFEERRERLLREGTREALAMYTKARQREGIHGPHTSRRGKRQMVILVADAICDGGITELNERLRTDCDLCTHTVPLASLLAAERIDGMSEVVTTAGECRLLCEMFGRDRYMDAFSMLARFRPALDHSAFLGDDTSPPAGDDDSWAVGDSDALASLESVDQTVDGRLLGEQSVDQVDLQGVEMTLSTSDADSTAESVVGMVAADQSPTVGVKRCAAWFRRALKEQSLLTVAASIPVNTSRMVEFVEYLPAGVRASWALMASEQPRVLLRVNPGVLMNQRKDMSWLRRLNANAWMHCYRRCLVDFFSGTAVDSFLGFQPSLSMMSFQGASRWYVAARPPPVDMCLPTISEGHSRYAVVLLLGQPLTSRLPLAVFTVASVLEERAHARSAVVALRNSLLTDSQAEVERCQRVGSDLLAASSVEGCMDGHYRSAAMAIQRWWRRFLMLTQGWGTAPLTPPVDTGCCHRTELATLSEEELLSAAAAFADQSSEAGVDALSSAGSSDYASANEDDSEMVGEPASAAHSSSSSAFLRMAWVLGLCTPGAVTHEDREQSNTYQHDEHFWRDDFHAKAHREEAMRTLKHEYSSHKLRRVVNEFTVDESIVRDATVNPLVEVDNGPVHFTPCLFKAAAYRRTDISGTRAGRADLQRIRRMLCDIGASINVIDKCSVNEMARDGAANVVTFAKSRVQPARVAGGGTIHVLGKATLEFQLQDCDSGAWESFKEEFFVVEGKDTIILGNTFHHKYSLQLDIVKGFASYESGAGKRFSTRIDALAPGCIHAVEATSDALAYTAEVHDLPKECCTFVKARVPITLAGQRVHVSRMTDPDAYVNRAGLMVSECNYAVGKDGSVLLAVTNMSSKDKQLPAMTALGRYSVDFETRSCQASEEQIGAIVDALHIESASPEELITKKQEVKDFIVLQRTGYFDKDRLGRCCVGEFHVDTPTVDSGERAPPNILSRPLNPEQLEAAKAEWQKMVQQGVLVPSTSPWGAPIVMVRKPGGRGWRMCLDFRAGNELAVKQHYPLPRVQDALDRIGSASYFASLDCLKAFWQIPNSKSTQSKTAINFPWGKWEFTTMPMGMQAASATFQRTMDVLLRDLSFAVGFIDDVLIYSNTWQEHLLHVACVLDRIGGAGFTFNAAKCEIGRSSTKFLGHIVSREGIHPDSGKLDVIRNAPFPSSKKDLHKWVSFANYYANFVPDFALVTSCIQEYVHSKPKDSNGRFTTADPPDQQVRDAFETVKEALCKEPVLIRPDFSVPFILEVDAAKKIGGCGATLGQERDGEIRSISHWSVRWLDATANWAPVEHECYAFRRACERYYDYVSAQWFLVYTDSEPLVWLQTLRRPKGRMAEWILELQALDFEVRHRPGILNVKDDALSRLALEHRLIDADRGNVALNERSPFEATSTELSSDNEGLLTSRIDTWGDETRSPLTVVAPGDTGVRHYARPAAWQRRPVSCVLTDGCKVLVLPAVRGGYVLPSAVKRFKSDSVQSSAIHALEQVAAPHRLTATAFYRLGSYLQEFNVVKDRNTVHVVFRRAAIDLFEDAFSVAFGCEDAAATWVPFHVLIERGVRADDCAMARRLDMLFNRRMPSHAALVASLDVPSAPVPRRAAPQFAIATLEDAASALRDLQTHLLRVVGTEMSFIVVDFEYDALAFGIDLVQVATGSLTLVFDTLLFPNVLTDLFLPEPGHDTAVPTLRYWFTSPRIRVVAQSCENDVSKLHHNYGIEVSNLFDTCLADGVLHGARNGRNLKLLVEAYLPAHQMSRKGTFQHAVGLFKIRPISEEVFEYAWQDVIDGPELYMAMLELLSSLQLAMTLELSQQRGERCDMFTQVSVVVCDEETLLTFDGSPLSIEKEGRNDNSVGGKRFKLEARSELRNAVATKLSANAAFATEICRKLGNPRAIGVSLTYYRCVDLRGFVPLPAGVLRVPLIATAMHEGTSMTHRFARWSCVQKLLKGNVLIQNSDLPKPLRCTSRIIHSEADVSHVHECDCERRSPASDSLFEPDEDRYDTLLQTWIEHCQVVVNSFEADDLARLAVTAVAVAPVVVCEKLEPDASSDGFTHVVTIVHDKKGRFLLLDREPSTAIGRADSSTLASPCLRTTEDLTGVYRAHHALNMLFGPVRTFERWPDPARCLRLVARVTVEPGPGNKRGERHGIYVFEVESLDDLPVQEVFDHRRLTMTHANLFPGFRICDATEAYECVNDVERSVLKSLFAHRLQLQVDAAVAATSLPHVGTPPLPDAGFQSEHQ